MTRFTNDYTFCKYGTEKGEWKPYFKDDKYIFDVNDYEKKLAFERDFIKIMVYSKACIIYCIICIDDKRTNGVYISTIYKITKIV